MANKNVYKRIGAIALAAVLTAHGVGAAASALSADNLWKMRSGAQTQMSSSPEIVYVNAYNGQSERTNDFDSNWKFYLGEAGEAQTPGYDDSRWRMISLPHDYSIEQEFSKSMEAESGYLPGGTGWYRKNFTVGKELKDKRLRIDFDGVYMNATVWVNGHQLGTHPYGYTPFSFDITDYVKFGDENTIAVKVDHKTPSSRWYSGSGIYRSVKLTITDEVHVDLFGTKIETPKLEEEKGGNVTVNVRTDIVNDSAEAKDVTVTHTIFAKGGDTSDSIGTVTAKAAGVAAGEKKSVDAVLTAAKPELWSPENPKLYTVRTEVKTGNKIVDTYDTDYGFRYFAVNNNTGFYLNGENLKLKGVCMHHDQGALGAAANRRAIERQVEILQEMGCNSIRVTHNPAAQELIDVCNEKGILVIDEFFDGWMYSKNGNSNDYAVWFKKNIESGNEILHQSENMTWAEFDLKATVKRGQNAPSIIMWSLGNEIQEGAGGTGYDKMADSLIKWTQETDSTRIVTIGSNAVKNYAGEHVAIGNKLTAAGGMSGTNYSNGASYDSLHRDFPEWNLYGSETASSVNSRGIYTTKANNSLDGSKQLTSYDKSSVGWGALASAAWYDVITRDFLAGEYVWTGFDYIGEPTPANGIYGGAVGAWPSPKNSYFGIVDTAGFPKDSYYLYQSLWNDKVHTLHILPAWNEDALMKDGSNKVEVVVYSDAAKVKLFLNDKLVGEQEFETKKTAEGYTYQQVKGQTGHQYQYMTFSVPFEAGTLRAEAYDAQGNKITGTQGRSAVTTTGAAAKLAAEADRTEITADGKDLAYITVDVTDQDGNIVPNAANRVKFDVQGAGVLVGVDNGSSPDHDSYKGTERNAFSGKVLAIVQSKKAAGEITVKVSADGLTGKEVKITAKAAEGGNAGKEAESFEMSKTYYVTAGHQPELPKTIRTLYTDGTSADLPVVWEKITDEQIQQSGIFKAKGVVDGKYDVFVNINMITVVDKLLNYTTSTPEGIVPKLPSARQAVMPDGTIMSAAFDVEWMMPDDSAFASAENGPVQIRGIADVFGNEVEVTAIVRIQKEQAVIGDSISDAAYLSQNIPEDQQSDTLDAIKDGDTGISDNTGGGANPTAWSNWQYSQAGNTKAELTFRYDTQQRIGEAVIYFAKDSGSMRYPDAGTTEIYVSETGADGSWTKLNATETIGAEAGRVTPYTYSFEATPATFVKVCLENTKEPTGTQWKACTAITEVELKKVTSAQTAPYSTAVLSGLSINGTKIPETELAGGSYTANKKVTDLEAFAADNAAVTILPAYDGEIRIVIESEDHTERNVFTVRGAE